MTEEATEILESLDRQDDQFKDQVERARAFRERLENAGVHVKQNGFTVPLMQRLETLGSPMLVARASAN
ncbi:hypothetical protein [Brevundimonas aveniformis]|uniref:hypothetical protein n=1 Tax=Brevundimonas aveniformis TaxID=370977 RepID=UPI0004014247|nr:hypothetical protein [Brevundimonas aveniformis]